MEIKCPKCGNTQARHLVGGAYLCDCGRMFYIENGEILTATEICEKYEQANKREE